MICKLIAKFRGYKFYPSKLYYFSPNTQQISVLNKRPENFFFDINNQPVSYSLPNSKTVSVQKKNDGSYVALDNKFGIIVHSSAEDAIDLHT